MIIEKVQEIAENVPEAPAPQSSDVPVSEEVVQEMLEQALAVPPEAGQAPDYHDERVADQMDIEAPKQSQDKMIKNKGSQYKVFGSDFLQIAPRFLFYPRKSHHLLKKASQFMKTRPLITIQQLSIKKSRENSCPESNASQSF